MQRFQINIDKIYSFPLEVVTVCRGDVFLVIAPDTANWMVLQNLKQLNVFKYLSSGYSIKDALAFFQDDDSVRMVVTQIEARHFCSKQVKSVNSDFHHMHLYLTNSCNLACPHCYMYSGKNQGDELTTAEIKQLLSAFRNAGGENITLSGGEPSLRIDFDEIVIFASKLGLKVRVLTNGSLWNKRRVDILSPYLDSIQVSIDGFSEETNAPIRGIGNFAIALQTIDFLVTKGVNVAVAVTPPYKLLKHYFNEYVSFAKDLIFKYKNYNNFLVKFSEGLLNGREVCPTSQQNQEYYSLIQRIRKAILGEKFEVLSFAHAVSSNYIMDNCMYGVFAVAANGDVFLCARTSDVPVVANIRNTPFGEVVKISNQAANATLISKLKPCGRCELRFICGGGCRIDEFPELIHRVSFDSIDYDSIPPRKCCAEMKNRFYDLMILSNEYLYSTL